MAVLAKVYILIARWPLYQGLRGGRSIKVVIVGELRGVFSEAECIIYIFFVSFILRFYLPIFSGHIFQILARVIKGI